MPADLSSDSPASPPDSFWASSVPSAVIGVQRSAVVGRGQWIAMPGEIPYGAWQAEGGEHEYGGRRDD
jgi:hypothetical protein